MLSALERSGDHQKHPTHTCPIDGCTSRLAYEVLMCRDHWAMVPLELRRKVAHTWGAANKGRASWLEYLEVRQSAIDAVVAQLPVPERVEEASDAPLD